MADGTKNISEMVNGLWEELQRKEPFTGSDADLSTSLLAYLQGVDIKTLWDKADGKKKMTATEWRTTQRTYAAVRGTNQLAVTPEEFDEALEAYLAAVTGISATGC